MKSRALIFCALLCLSAEAERVVQLCPGFILHSEQKIKLTDAEEKLVCGFSDNPAWSDIPPNQALFHMKSFLQTRGVYDARFEIKGKEIHIFVGEPVRVKSLVVKEGPLDLDSSRLRRVEKELLTPALLNSVRDRLLLRLQTHGYPCPAVTMEANYNTGEVVATVKAGQKQVIQFVGLDNVEGVDTDTLDRYWTFELGDDYDANNLALTNQRLLDDGVVQSSYFLTDCAADGARLQQKYVPGPARLLRIGFGVDTERYLIGRTSWRNGRLGPRASAVEIVALASFLSQSLTLTGTWYPTRTFPRLSLRPSITIEHNNPKPYEELVGKVRSAIVLTKDTRNTGYMFSVAPTTTWSKTLRGTGPASAHFFSLGLSAQGTDHLLELYRSSPFSGYKAQFDAELAQRGVWSDFTAQKLHLSFQYLWNVGDYEPSFLVLGLRANVGTVVGSSTQNPASIPAGFRFYLGGSPDLRGFSLRELPVSGSGALTYFTTSLEARLTDLLPAKLQPIFFADLGMVGEKSMSLTPPIFWSPGFGLRWESPIGVLRSTLAHGFFSSTAPVTADHSHWQFYFSLGEEF